MGAVATFDYGWWIARYPEFVASGTYAGVNQLQAGAYFLEAGLYWLNDGTGPVNNPVQQSILMNMLTAHIAFLAVGTNKGPSAASQGLVGRVSSAGQGSVNLSVDYAGTPGSDAWFNATPYGAAFIKATKGFRLGGLHVCGPKHDLALNGPLGQWR